MTKKELIADLQRFNDDDVVVCMDEYGSWDNIEHLKEDGGVIAIVWGGGSPFSDE